MVFNISELNKTCTVVHTSVQLYTQKHFSGGEEYTVYRLGYTLHTNYIQFIIILSQLDCVQVSHGQKVIS